jgi:hypothetical protein
LGRVSCHGLQGAPSSSRIATHADSTTPRRVSSSSALALFLPSALPVPSARSIRRRSRTPVRPPAALRSGHPRYSLPSPSTRAHARLRRYALSAPHARRSDPLCARMFARGASPSPPRTPARPRRSAALARLPPRPRAPPYAARKRPLRATPVPRCSGRNFPTGASWRYRDYVAPSLRPRHAATVLVAPRIRNPRSWLEVRHGRGALAPASRPPRRVRHSRVQRTPRPRLAFTALAANVPATTTYIVPRRTPAAPARTAPALRRSRRNFPTGASSRYSHCCTSAGSSSASTAPAVPARRRSGRKFPTGALI